jgi:hypothetical protein
MAEYQTVSPYDWLVQVWDEEELLGSGIVVGDGSQVLTAIVFSAASPEDLDLKVVASDYSEYKASVEVIDSRTCAALLQLEDADLPLAPVSTGDATQPQPVDVQGWDIVYQSATPSTAIAFNEVRLSVNSNPGLCYEYESTPAEPSFFLDVPLSGAAATDAEGKVIGLLGVFMNAFGLPTPFGIIPMIISMDSALKLLSPDAAEQLWANGPLQYIYSSVGGSTSRQVYNLYDYAEFTASLLDLFARMGESVQTSELPQPYSIWGRIDDAAHSLTIIYASPVELRDADGNIVARARLLSFYYTNDNEPAYLYYFDENLSAIEGGFTLLATVSEVKAVIPP